MARILSILVGLFFTMALAWSLLVGLFNFELPHTVEHDFYKHPKEPVIRCGWWHSAI